MMKTIALAACFIAAMAFTASLLEQQRVLAAPTGARSEAQTKWQWTTESWTGDNKPYEKARKAIDEAVASGTDPEALIAQYKAAALKFDKQNPLKPPDPLAAYRWGYAAWKSITPNSSRADRSKNISGVRQILDNARSPKTSEYARLKFLVDAATLPRSEQLMTVGARLLKLYPNDYDVKYQYLRVTMGSVRPEGIKRSLSYAQDLVRMDPKRPSAYAAMGYIYMFSWQYLHKAKDAQKAIDAFQTYLRLVSPDSDSRQDIQGWIDHIKKASK